MSLFAKLLNWTVGLVGISFVITLIAGVFARLFRFEADADADKQHHLSRLKDPVTKPADPRQESDRWFEPSPKRSKTE